LILFDRNEERGEELKVPYHARAMLVRDGNMPGVTAACLIPDSFNILSLHSLLQLAVIVLLYWFKVYSKGNLYYIKFE